MKADPSHLIRDHPIKTRGRGPEQSHRGSTPMRSGSEPSALSGTSSTATRAGSASPAPIAGHARVHVDGTLTAPTNDLPGPDHPPGPTRGADGAVAVWEHARSSGN